MQSQCCRSGLNCSCQLHACVGMCVQDCAGSLGLHCWLLQLHLYAQMIEDFVCFDSCHVCLCFLPSCWECRIFKWCSLIFAGIRCDLMEELASKFPNAASNLLNIKPQSNREIQVGFNSLMSWHAVVDKQCSERHSAF